MTTETIKDLGGQPAPEGYASWNEYLEQQARPAQQCVGGHVTMHTMNVNCHYIVFPDGSMIQRVGNPAYGIMQRIDMIGWEVVLEEQRELYDTVMREVNRVFDRWDEREVCAKCGGETQEGLLHRCVK